MTGVSWNSHGAGHPENTKSTGWCTKSADLWQALWPDGCACQYRVRPLRAAASPVSVWEHLAQIWLQSFYLATLLMHWEA